MIANSKRRMCAAIAIAILLLAVFMPQPDYPGIWLRSLFEWLHVPVFGLISLAILSLTPTSWRRSQRFGLALLGSVMLGVLTEAAQIPIQRDASWEDLIADATGAAGFLAFAYAVGRKQIVQFISAISAIAILLWSASPLIAVTKALAHRNSQFPVIFNGDIDSEKTFVSGLNLRMESRWRSGIGIDSAHTRQIASTWKPAAWRQIQSKNNSNPRREFSIYTIAERQISTSRPINGYDENRGVDNVLREVRCSAKLQPVRDQPQLARPFSPQNNLDCLHDNQEIEQECLVLNVI